MTQIRKILIVDDDIVDRMALVRVLQKEGLELDIKAAASGEICLQAVENETYDCIFLDYHLPGKNGLEVIQRLRAQGVKTPVIVMTGGGDEDTAVSFMKAGANDYISKTELSGHKMRTRMLNCIRLHEAEILASAAEVNRQLFARAVEFAADGIVITDSQGIIQVANKAFGALLGVCEEELNGLDIFVLGFNQDLTDKELILQALAKTGFWQEETVVKKGEGQLVEVDIRISVVMDVEGKHTHLVAFYRDVTDWKKAEKQLNYLAYYDKLTGLPNRLFFIEQLEFLIERLTNQKAQMGVLLINLKRFKVINETLGHRAGDLVLLEVAQRLRVCTGKDTLVHLGADQFAIIRADIPQVEPIISLADNIIEQLSKPILVGDHELYVDASVGISVYPSDGGTTEELIRAARIAMASAEQDETNRVKLHAPAMSTASAKKLHLEKKLRQALKENQLFLNYQTQVELLTGRITGVEALVRWDDPCRGIIYPGEFIPLAEETGLIIKLDEWVLRTACQEIKRLHSIGLRGLHLSVNLSACQFYRQTLIDAVNEVLVETDFDPSLLTLEITETVAMNNAEFTTRVMGRLKDMGVNLSIDDFGIGYSSLSYLKRFPLNSLKIDRSFIRDLEADGDNDLIVKSIIDLAHIMKLTVVAEGVETRSQLELLRKFNCDYGQGYFFNKPMACRNLSELLKECI